jgi:DNA-binding transcriptional ArsR family regulator
MQTFSDQLNSTFSALADPTRRAILTRLSSGEASVQDLAQPFKMTLPAVSKHLKVLEKARLIRRGRTAQWRPCYLVAEPLKEASDWMEQYRKFWEESFERLDAYLKILQAKEKEPKPATKKSRRKTKKSKGEKRNGKQN